ncbi:HAD family hydrolase [Halolamina sp. CBA1230]|uniref:HAD family hydrolase n=1 Tax=Halolamina sp. CBA1230 TaxID=1853690 RepID=UPI0009A19691|nr:HAD family hydrolase [Halolamina sp. CBA1230]QKY19144.1 HAD family hydrolase [Halolamina sp. CBA1230]
MGDDEPQAATCRVGQQTTDGHSTAPHAASFDCFGTLVYLPRPNSPAAAIAEELTAQGIELPADWAAAYTEPHLDRAEGAELSLPNHARAALSSRGVDAPQSVVEAAVLDAFDREAEILPGAVETLDAVDTRAGVLSNCSIPGLVPRTLSQVDLFDRFDTVVTSVEVGWRKPHRRAFAAVADELDVAVDALVHVGDNREADGGIERYGGRYRHVDGDLTGLAERLADAVTG